MRAQPTVATRSIIKYYAMQFVTSQANAQLCFRRFVATTPENTQ